MMLIDAIRLYVCLKNCNNMFVIELDDGKILTGKPIKFDGKNHGFPVDFPLNQSSEFGHLWLTSFQVVSAVAKWARFESFL